MKGRGDRGSVSVELVVLAPLIGVLLLGVVLVGRVQTARADIEGAARSAARDLSLARDPGLAASAVYDFVAQTLDVGSPGCRQLTVTPVVGVTEVSVSVTCSVDLRDAAVLPVPATMQVSATATEVRDRYREGAP